MSRRPLVLLLGVLLAGVMSAGLVGVPAAGAGAVPEPSTGVTGVPFAGTTPSGEVRGYLDAHSHLMSYEAFGGKLMCGKPFDEKGVAAALRDCPDHEPHGVPAWFENFTRHGTPFGTHDTRGYPDFPSWPAANSLTHQQTYHAWIERSWRAGQRVLVNQLVANRVLCEIYPLKKNACDEMDSLRLQAKRTREMEAYIDRRAGGPGKGWFRIVESPEQARQVIQQGKLAVVLGVEASEPFGCGLSNGAPRCTEAQIDKGLDELHALGVRSMFVCHKFDNALCGVRFDSDALGVILNLGNFVGTGRFWQADACSADAPHDNPIAPAGGLGDLLAGPLRDLRGHGITAPLYPSGTHCNVNGLTPLGEHAIKGMMQRKMIVELDHMSAKAADRALTLLEEARYSGVMSSHSWTDERYVRRVYGLGGMVASYGHGAEAFIATWRRTKALHDGGSFGFGYGLDANGMGPLPPRRAGAEKNPLRYPYRSPIDPGVTVDRQRTGNRTWDVNTEGVANYGLVPDWIADMGNLAGEPIITDLSRGAEEYLRMWGRTTR
ncbi:membrane dipeptidase [Actinomadura flavalba]|uniref:membrane dipeptidase n=1 Tax=Actinomadura flavalba TaxID=1120938 RepID=UPI00037899BA|nr:membrane dipeptidase [Actinomadura flavalba]